MPSNRRRVVVTGMGAITPVGLDAASSWAAIKRGTSGIGPITLFDTADYRTRIAGEVSEWDNSLHFERKDARRLDRFSEFFIVASRQAISDAGLDYSGDPEAASRVGCHGRCRLRGHGLVHRGDRHAA